MKEERQIRLNVICRFFYSAFAFVGSLFCAGFSDGASSCFCLGTGSITKESFFASTRYVFFVIRWEEKRSL